MKSFRRSAVALAVVACIGFAAPAIAGNNDGSLKGQIVDSTEQSVAGATVTISDPSTGFTRTVVADSEGKYRFGSLPIGKYTLTSSKDGFTVETNENISIRIGESKLKTSLFRADVERISVSGRSIAVIDTTSSESALNIGFEEIGRLPIARNLTSVALLAPGANLGDSAFGELPSFGGSSVAENAYFINGLNVTDFRNGIGGSTVPFEFYQEFEVKTGGYSAEFGRSTGGVINAVTKSGSNEFKTGLNVFYTPNALAEQAPNVTRVDGTTDIYNEFDYYNKLEANIYASGAIIKDTLFFYALYNPRNIKRESVTGSGANKNKESNDDAFWGAKIDWNITDDHILELTAFSDSRRIINNNQDWNAEKGYVSSANETTGFTDLGGDNISLKYTGYITDDITVSALWGNNEASSTTKSSLDANPAIYDARSGSFVKIGNFANFTVADAKDEREAFRFDAEYAGFSDHLIRVGFDREVNSSFDQTANSGGVYWAYFAYEAGESISAIDVTFDEDTEIVRRRDYSVGGDFETLSDAFYIEDTWYVTDNITANLGLRLESFNNKNATGDSFIKIDNQIAPRLGISWDINGDGESKLFANLGRYHIPVAANTNIRMAGAETFIHTYSILNGINPDDTPVIGTELGQQINGDGSVPDVREVLDTSIDPMYQDEFIVGYQAMINDEWSYGIKYTRRDLKSIIDDITIDKAIRANGWSPASGNVYVLTNPNTDIKTFYDTDGDGTLDPVSIAAADLGYSNPERIYDAIDLTLNRAWDDVWSLNMTYTWSHSRGNAEGYVKSDNGQDDAGLTTDWDFPYLMDGAYGDLPNDRRHAFKVFGAYSITEDFSVGLNMALTSGRPISGFGHGLPDDYDEFDKYAYGQTYYLGADNEAFAPRGAFGRTAWIAKFDLSAKYTLDLNDYDIELRADIFNLLDAQGVTEVDEDQNDGTVNADFLLPTSFQQPRYAEFSVSIRY